MTKKNFSYLSLRIKNFKNFKRAYLSLKIFLCIFTISLFAEFIANDKPLFMYIKGYGSFFPVFIDYTEKDFGGQFPTYADYKDKWVLNYIDDNGFAIWP